MRRTAVLLSVVLLAGPAAACTFCSGGLLSRQTLGEQYAAAPVVLQGRLKNPKFHLSGVGGTTELHVDHAAKTVPTLGAPKVVVISKYFPVIGDTPPDYLIFADVRDGKLDFVSGVPATAAVGLLG